MIKVVVIIIIIIFFKFFSIINIFPSQATCLAEFLVLVKQKSFGFNLVLTTFKA